MTELLINGTSLTIEQVVKVSEDPNIKVRIDPTAIPNIQKAADAVQRFIQEGRIAYGITTGFGAFKDKLISVDDVENCRKYHPQPRGRRWARTR